METELVTADQVSDAVLGGAWVVDLRSRTSFARAHLAGTVNVEYGEQFATYVGWLVPCEDDIVLLTDAPALLEEAVRDLADIGIDAVSTHVIAPGSTLPAAYRVSDWSGFERSVVGSRVVVDVRPREEYDAGHLVGAVHLAVQDVARSAPLLPPGEIWVHCRSGCRAAVAASVLHRMGRAVVHVDDAWERVADLAIATTGDSIAA
jgi:hydroxyacylglutathione hydrolase